MSLINFWWRVALLYEKAVWAWWYGLAVMLRCAWAAPKAIPAPGGGVFLLDTQADGAGAERADRLLRLFWAHARDQTRCGLMHLLSNHGIKTATCYLRRAHNFIVMSLDPKRDAVTYLLGEKKYESNFPDASAEMCDLIMELDEISHHSQSGIN